MLRLNLFVGVQKRFWVGQTGVLTSILYKNCSINGQNNLWFCYSSWLMTEVSTSLSQTTEQGNSSVNKVWQREPFSVALWGTLDLCPSAQGSKIGYFCQSSSWYVPSLGVNLFEKLLGVHRGWCDMVLRKKALVSTKKVPLEEVRIPGTNQSMRTRCHNNVCKWFLYLLVYV